MKRRLILGGAASAIGAAVASLVGCASQKMDSYRGEKPLLDLQQYFNGTLDAYGVFTDRSGTVVKRFTVVMECSWKDGQGLLDESFSYVDGSVQKRIWRLTALGDGRYTGRADDVVGQAQGQALGNAFHWNYTLALPVDGRVYDVQFDDWMYLVNDRVMLNKASMRKFGIYLGEVTLSFSKR
ncbi:MAG: DUF3833 domain-containing protein [Betaproteobacteria bacterium]